MRSYELTGKRCYDHLGGKLGAELFDFLVLQKWIELKEKSAVLVGLPVAGITLVDALEAALNAYDEA